MAVSGHLLILLIPVLSLCGATEYYVRPTGPTNTSCPAQPCLTLNQYVNDSDHYFQSNTVFKFLPGTHHMDRPVTIGNVHNMSLESSSEERPHLMAQFSCKVKVHDCITVIAWKYEFDVCCAAIWMYDVHNVTVKGIIATVQTPNISGIILRKVSSILIQQTTTYSLTEHHCLGIAIFEANSADVQSASAHNCTRGIMLYNTTNSHISDITATYNEIGVMLIVTSNLSITNTVVRNNGWEGMHMYIATDSHITNTTATNNGFLGIYLIYSNNIRIDIAKITHSGSQGMTLKGMKNTSITNVVLKLNGWRGLYAGFQLDEQISFFSSTNAQIYNSSFIDIYTSRTDATGDPSRLPVVIGFHESSVNISGCNFTGNHISSIRGDASNITVSGEVIFSSNKAITGTAFILVQGSTLSLAESGYIDFLNNHATSTGGVFYIATDLHLKNDVIMVQYQWPMSKCFLNIRGSRSQTRLTFVNNSAGKGGDILYGGQVVFGLDGDWNCLDSFKNISNISQNSLSLISSDPSRVCLCNGTGQLDCLTLVDPTPHSIYPGQSISISAVVVGQDFGTVAGSVYAQFLPTSPPESQPQLQSGQKVQPVTQQNCSKLYYTILSQSEVLETGSGLVLTAHDSYVSKFLNNTKSTDEDAWKRHYHTSTPGPLIYENSPVYVNITLLPCPLGFMLTTDPPFRCDCNHLLQNMNGIQCHIQEQTIGRSGLLWVGMIQDDNGTNGTVAASEYCSFNYCNRQHSNVALSVPDSQCNFNHSGILCGGCQPGLSLALGSAQCLPCSNTYLTLLIPFTLAGLVLVGAIKLLDLTISHGTLNGLVFYANIVKVNEYIFFPQRQTNPLTLFLAWLNLDLGVETCFFHGLSSYSKTWLQFVFPLYIWSIAGLIIILAKYSDRVAKVMGNNSVPVLATLFLLSYAKLFHTTITALSYTVVYTSHGHKVVWTADGNVDYLGLKHAPLFAVAVGTLLFLWLPYTLLLFLGQWLHMCKCQLISRMLMKIKPFLDAHYGPLKGKHRYWFGALLLVRAEILLIQALVPSDHGSTVVLCILVFAVVLAYYGQLVYSNLSVSVFDTAFFMNLALLTGINLFASTVGQDPSVATYILTGVAFAQFIGLILFKLFRILKQNVMAYFYKEQPVEDDWEAYEEAAVLREKEAAPKEQEKESRDSYESIAKSPKLLKYH